MCVKMALYVYLRELLFVIPIYVYLAEGGIIRWLDGKQSDVKDVNVMVNKWR